MFGEITLKSKYHKESLAGEVHKFQIHNILIKNQHVAVFPQKRFLNNLQAPIPKERTEMTSYFTYN